MELVRWNPWGELFNRRSRVNRIWDDFFDPTTGQANNAMDWSWNPVVDVYETDDQFVIKADLPGIAKEDIDLNVKDRVLTLKGERRLEKDGHTENVHSRERFYGRFERAFRLPNHVDGDKITADYKDGVLKIEIPKPEAIKPKQITVH